MIDIQKLRPDEFEILVGLLLKREGHQIVRGPGPMGTLGPDYETVSPNGNPVLVDVKHMRAGIGKSWLFRFAGDLERYRQQQASATGLLVASGTLSSGAKESLSQFKDVNVWDRESVLSRLGRHADLESIFQSAINSKVAFQASISGLLDVQTTRADDLARMLRALPCGREHWREYERICTEILTFIFSPELAAPDIQLRSDDGLDILDAIFPIRSSSASTPWSMVRTEFRTRFVVAEFKNHCAPIGQSEVESIAQYLWRPAQRFFGILVSRSAPSASAIAQRRRKWLEDEKCIVFLSDNDLFELLQLRTAQNEPFTLIDAQLEDFFRTLTP